MQGVPEDSPVVFEMELVGFQRQQHWTSLAAADKIRRAEVKTQSAVSWVKALLSSLHASRLGPMTVICCEVQA